MAPRPLLALTAVLATALLGCPRGSATKKAPGPCLQLGQQCQLEEGKLGACSYRAECPSSGSCLYCQSQH